MQIGGEIATAFAIRAGHVYSCECPGGARNYNKYSAQATYEDSPRDVRTLLSNWIEPVLQEKGVAQKKNSVSNAGFV